MRGPYTPFCLALALALPHALLAKSTARETLVIDDDDAEALSVNGFRSYHSH